MNLRHYYQRWHTYKRALKTQNRLLYTGVDLVETLLVALCLALLIRHFIIMTSLVPSESMVPTFLVKDRLFVNKFIYRFHEPERGDIVVFKSPNGDGKDYVKRLVGLPNDVLEVKKGDIYINGVPVIFSGVTVLFDYDYYGPVIVPEGHYFMMGDNRANSLDSRRWTDPFVPRKDLKGKAWFTFWPISRMRVLR